MEKVAASAATGCRAAPNHARHSPEFAPIWSNMALWSGAVAAMLGLSMCGGGDAPFAVLWSTPFTLVGRQLIAPRRTVGGHAYDILTHVGSLQLSNLKLSINDNDLVMRDMRNGFCSSCARNATLPTCGLTAHKPAQQRNPLAIHLARNHDHPNHDRRQALPARL